MRRHTRQLTLDDARKPDGGHGGWRPGAGRPRGRTKVPHLARPRLSRHHPCHVTVRVVDGLTLRREDTVEAIRRAIAAAHKPDFRVIHFVVLGNHLHLITEASTARALARGMQGLLVRLARAINHARARRGRVFVERYHARALATPREVRNALRYVLCNARHHGNRAHRTWIDPYSSAPWFDGWCDPIDARKRYLRPLVRRLAPVAPPETWLLREGWRKRGLLAFDEVPLPPTSQGKVSP